MSHTQDLQETTLESQCLYDGAVLHLYRDRVRLPDGGRGVREYCKHNGGVCVVAITKEDKLLLVEQYRYAHGRVVTELPAGKLEPGEDPMAAARRELREETGAECRQLLSLGQMYPSPALMDEVIYMYLATGLSFGDSAPDADEFLRCKELPFDTVVEQILAGELRDAKTQTAVLKAKLLRQAPPAASSTLDTGDGL